MYGKLSRREFLKATAATMAMLSLSSQLPLPRARAQSKLMTEGPNAFTPVASVLPTGNAIMDISAGWDGTQWAVDAQGIPHVYDGVQQNWETFGRGVDAATLVGDDLYLFRDNEVAIYNTTNNQLVSTQLISEKWPQLPPMFTKDLDGAIATVRVGNIGGEIFLFHNGRYVNVNEPTTPQLANKISQWPTGSPDGIIYAAGTMDSFGVLFLQPTGLDTFIVEPTNGSTIASSNNPLSDFYFVLTEEIRDILGEGIDAFAIFPTNNDQDIATSIFRGPALWTFVDQGGPTVTSLGDLVPAWSPRLAHAPRGQVGSLWGLATDGTIMQHDGDDWNPILPPDGVTVTHIDVGHDGQPFALAQSTSGAGGATLHAYDLTEGSWQTPVSLGGITPQQLSVGDATRVYVLGSDNVAHRLQEGAFAPVSELGSNIKHIAANHDGTVWHSDDTASAYRFISERTYPPTQLPVPNAAGIQKVASTAYGNALMLDSANQLHTYASPYLYKTSPSYVPIANGLVIQHPQVTAGSGLTYVNEGASILALDSHTGEELWGTLLPNQGECTSVVYDPVHRLIYATDNAQTLFALDANTGAEVWYFQAGAGPISQPALRGGGLCVVGGGTVHWLDTAAALTQGTDQSVTPAWSTVLENETDFTGATAIIYLDTIYVGLYYNLDGPNLDIWSLNAHDGSGANDILNSYTVGDFTVPAISTAKWNDDDGLFMFNNDGISMTAIPIDPFFVDDPILRLPNNATFTQGLAVIDVADANAPGGRQHVLIAGGSDGNLYQLDLTKSLNDFPEFTQFNLQKPTGGGVIGAGPMTVHSGGSSMLAFSLSLNGNNSVCVVDPTTGSFLDIPTDHMLATQLTVDEHGILYAAGLDPEDRNSPFGQVYAIRIDDLLQAERDFIVESDLMQDFDEDTPGQLTTTARYQTHVTVVDANKAPRPFQAIKVWADVSTALLIDGKPYTVDATTPASVQTDATGSLTIVSDATDLSTGALSLWAGFMDPYERIVVYPDREFHNRLATTHYESTANPDPTRINLATAAPYDTGNLTNPPPLFSGSEQPQATAAAAVTSKLTSAVGYQSGGTTTSARALAATTAATTAAAGAYLAYDDLTGAAYSPVATPANRAVVPTASTGLSFDGATMTELTPATAAAAIDALEGTPEELPGSFVSWLRGLWDDIKSGVTKVEQIVISVGRDIYIGLKYIANGVVKVLRQALRDIVDVAIAIGSVFVQLGKDIVKVAEALSIIFHLGEVLKTASTIKSVFTTMTNDLAGAIAGTKTTVDNFFNNAENEINSAFDSIVAELTGSTAASLPAAATSGIGGLSGMGATPRTVFAVGPKGSGQNSSQAVPAMWGMHKLRQNYAKGTTPATAGENPLSQFLQSFFTRPATPRKSARLTAISTPRSRSGRPRSSLPSLLVDLLDALKALVDDVLVLVERSARRVHRCGEPASST